jgi:hypothetical protein
LKSSGSGPSAFGAAFTATTMNDAAVLIDAHAFVLHDRTDVAIIARA